MFFFKKKRIWPKRPLLNRTSALFLPLIFVLPLSGFSQISVHYLPYNQSHTNFRTASNDSAIVKLPFWDDFSTSKISPDTALWLNSNDVVIQSGMGINPPSVNVAVFDGADQFGNPYSNISTAIGEGDVLTSRFIDLSEADPASTYLSFYFQKEGNGESPDAEDSLSMFIKGADSVWNKVWNVSGEDALNSDEFYFVSVRVDDPNYFFEYFQFRFVSHGKISGPYDTWNVDYIYLNDGRTGERDDLIDHAAVTYPTSIFKKYTLVPYEHIIQDSEAYLADSLSIDIINLESQVTNIETTVELKHQNGGLFALINANKELPANINPYEIRATYSDEISAGLFEGISDSLYLKAVFSLNTLDSVSPLNLRVNDTVSTHFHIHHDLAYDDGTAEYGAGLNISGAQIAYRFHTPIEDQLTGVKIYFPKFEASGSRAFIIKIWDSLRNESTQVLYSQEAIVQNPSTFDEFGFYRFLKPVTVLDTFYIGFQQTIDDFFLVGLDKNTDSGEDIFFNSDVVWKQNTLIQGSLMIRPVFGKAEDIVTGLDPEEEEIFINVYPNPSQGTFIYEGPSVGYEVYDIFGKHIKTGQLTNYNRLDLSHQKPGVYLLRLRGKNVEKNLKLIIR